MLNLWYRFSIVITWSLFLFSPAIGYAVPFSDTRDLMITQALDSMEAKPATSNSISQQYFGELNRSALLKQYGSKSKRNIHDEFRSLFGDQVYMNLGLESGYINGSSTFQFDFDNDYSVGGHGESELRWPLNNNLIGLVATFNSRLNKEVDDMRDRVRMELIWLTQLNKGAGKMQDSDWIENDLGYIDYNDDGTLNGSDGWATNHDGKDIYSESDADVSSLNIFDINYTYNFWPHKNLAIGPRVGYRYQQFNFSAYNVEQVGYGPYGPGPFDQSYIDTQQLRWGKYKATYSIPYLGLSSQLLWKEKLYLLFNCGFSDWVKVEDRDTHLYPTSGTGHNMVSKGSTEGFAYLYNFQGGWKFDKDWLLNLGATYVNLATKGDLTQYHYYYGVPGAVSDSTAHKVTSEYWLIDLSLRYHF